MNISILGTMTGTSCDGMDIVCTQFTSSNSQKSPRWKVLWSKTFPYPAALHKLVLEFQNQPSVDKKLLLSLDRDLAEWQGKQIKRVLRRERRRPAIVAYHGQTVAHFPLDRRRGTTLQLGDPARIAYLTGMSVISHFRNGDLAAGGQGAPLAPLFHRELLRSRNIPLRGTIVHNVGGMSNLTYFGKKVLAFDSGPGNIWIDQAVERMTRGRSKFDRDGKIAKKYDPNFKTIRRILKNTYFKIPPPKSTGRDDFPFSMLTRSDSSRGGRLVSTATQITVESIAQNYEKFILKKNHALQTVYLCGGGAKNPEIIRRLQERLPQIDWKTTKSLGIDPQHVEPVGFAYLAYCSLKGKPLGGTWTGVQKGAKAFAPPGKITPGANWSQVAKLIAKI